MRIDQGGGKRFPIARIPQCDGRLDALHTVRVGTNHKLDKNGQFQIRIMFIRGCAVINFVEPARFAEAVKNGTGQLVDLICAEIKVLVGDLKGDDSVSGQALGWRLFHLNTAAWRSASSGANQPTN